MNGRSTGLLAGMLLGFAAFLGGFVAFLLVATLGAVGWALGSLTDGDGAFRVRGLFERERR
ncbi:hypothetical protein G6W47_02500 [Streptomyces sp. CAI-21]|uniref:hypothetical protein n=1 Tax=Streptomyces TaxID=1883 RepID=UPI0005242BA3|nr:MULTISPECIES: hypothetical protein [Streptomyces]MCX5456874.1 hypothetical protein [Streptomyces sp. FT1]NUW05800.1 hypothetical protein [Streptomyces sp. CAI-21]NVI32082.1 hypothetical protein [Streptomyces sp. CAI-17]WAC97652.1 hypothetical protein OSU72_16520 [Streptomyces sp. NA13]